MGVKVTHVIVNIPLREPIARQNGCSSVRTYTGHGINQLFHTAPNVPHYAKSKAIGTMKPGMVRSSTEKILLFTVLTITH